MPSVDALNPVLVRMASVLATSQGRSDWQAFVSAAEATLRELREPSEDMLEAASHGLPDWGDLQDEWRAMIDHVLGDQAKINDNTASKKASRIAG